MRRLKPRALGLGATLLVFSAQAMQFESLQLRLTMALAGLAPKVAPADPGAGALAEANLADANLTDANLTDANLTDAAGLVLALAVALRVPLRAVPSAPVAQTASDPAPFFPPTPPLPWHSDVLRPLVALALRHSDNLLGFANRDVAKARTGSSETADTERRQEIGLDVARDISRQQVGIRLRMSRRSFERYAQLDHTETEALANWKWRAGERLQGEIGASHEHKLVPFEDFHFAERNLYALRRAYGDLRWQFAARWRATAGIARNGVRHELASQQSLDRDVLERSLGAYYISREDNSIGLRAIDASGTFIQAQVPGDGAANRYRKTELRSELDWRITAKTRVQANAGWVERRSGSDAGGDFTGPVGRASLEWQASAKSALTLTGWRELAGADERRTGSYALSRGVTLAPTWALSEKTRLEARLAIERYRSVPRAALSGVTSGSDATGVDESRRAAALALTYTPTRFLTVTPSLSLQKVDSATPDAGYRRAEASITARYQH